MRTHWPYGALALAALPLACLSNSSSPGTTGDNDGGHPVQGDAGSGTPDATTTDASGGSDAATDAPSSTQVTVHVVSSGVPESGIVIVFHDATGAVLSTGTTDTTGSVSQTVPAGGEVTAVFPGKLSSNLVTLQGVVPGDTLTIADVPSTGSTLDQVEVTLPSPIWDAAGSGIELYAGDCFDTANQPIFLYSDCQANGVFPLFAEAYDVTGHELAYTFQKGNAVFADGGLPDGDTGTAVTITRPWSLPSGVSETIAVTNIPSTPADAGAGAEPNLQLNSNWTEVANGVGYVVPASTSGVQDGGSQTSVFPTHPGYADSVQAQASFTYGNGLNNIESILLGVTRSAPPTSSQTANVDMATLPLITSSNADVTDAGTPQNPQVTWTTSTGSLAGADGIFTQLQWYGNPTDGAPSVSGTWTILGPSTATVLVAPQMPASLGVSTPGADALYQSPRMGAVKTSFAPGYAGLRSVFGIMPFFAPDNYVLTAPPLPANGTLFVSGIYPDEG